MDQSHQVLQSATALLGEQLAAKPIPQAVVSVGCQTDSTVRKTSFSQTVRTSTKECAVMTSSPEPKKLPVKCKMIQTDSRGKHAQSQTAAVEVLPGIPVPTSDAYVQASPPTRDIGIAMVHPFPPSTQATFSAGLSIGLSSPLELSQSQMALISSGSSSPSSGTTPCSPLSEASHVIKGIPRNTSPSIIKKSLTDPGFHVRNIARLESLVSRRELKHLEVVLYQPNSDLLAIKNLSRYLVSVEPLLARNAPPD